MRANIVAVLLLGLWMATASAQSHFVATGSERYVPQLGSIMVAAQLQHLKLWSAGRNRNWPLAAYELRQLNESLAEAATLYSGIPVSNVTTLGLPLQSISIAIEAKDRKAFVNAFEELGKGCNACHQAMDRAYIVIRVPDRHPFSNQVFSPGEKLLFPGAHPSEAPLGRKEE